VGDDLIKARHEDRSIRQPSRQRSKNLEQLHAGHICMNKLAANVRSASIRTAPLRNTNHRYAATCQSPSRIQTSDVIKAEYYRRRWTVIVGRPRFKPTLPNPTSHHRKLSRWCFCGGGFRPQLLAYSASALCASSGSTPVECILINHDLRDRLRRRLHAQLAAFNDHAFHALRSVQICHSVPLPHVQPAVAQPGGTQTHSAASDQSRRTFRLASTSKLWTGKSTCGTPSTPGPQTGGRR
jgi:hypothetical protein